MISSAGAIEQRFCAGEALDHIPVIDFHTHLAASSEYYFVPRSSADEVCSYLDRFGVDHMVVFSLAVTSDQRTANSVILDAARAHPGRMSALVALHAAFPEDWIGLLEQGAERGARGIKLISQYQGVPEQNIDWTPAFEFARSRNWVVLHHDWGGCERLEAWAAAFPEIVFIIGHASMSYKTVMERHDNVYQCTCAQLIMRDCTTAAMVAALPPEKILYGSDALDLDLGTGIGPIALADVPEHTKEMILGGNAVHLMERLCWNIQIKREALGSAH